MRKFFFPIVTMIAVTLVTGCTAPKTLVINIQKPAQITLPGSIESVIIANNLVVQPSFKGNTIQKYDNKNHPVFEEISVSTDSLGIILSGSLYDKLAGLNYFKEVSILDKPLREDLSYDEIRPIDSIAAKEICRVSKSDAIISIDKFHVVSNTKDDYDELGIKVKNLDLKMSATFSIYSKEGKLISNSLNLVDSIYWTALYNNNHLISDNDLPKREDALKESARYAGEKIANAFVPYWSEVPRLFFNENKEAVSLAEKDNWESARKIWESAYEQENKDKRKARIAFNIALANELTDNLKEAIKWATTSSALFLNSTQTSVDKSNYERAEDYKKELLERYKDFRLLDASNPKE